MKKFFWFVFFSLMLSLNSSAPRLSADSKLPFSQKEPDISMDFQDASLKDILKVFSIQSGLNFIASEGLQDRKITLYLDNVPMEQAMDKLFKANNLSYDLDKESRIFIVKDWGRPRAETVTKVFFLKYATVSSSSLKEEMSNQISSTNSGEGGGGSSSSGSSSSGSSGGGSGKWASESDTGITKSVKKLLSEVGSVIEDFRTNSLIVTDTPSRMVVVGEVIAALDVAEPQVLLEVEMLDVSKNTVDTMGVNWPTSLVSLDFTDAKRLVNIFGKNNGQNPDAWQIAPNNEQLTGPGAGGYAASRFGPTVLSVLNAQISLDFLRSQTDTKFLARPKLLTLNNETAEIKISTNESIGLTTSTTAAQSTGTTTQEAERSQTGVILRVTPQINIEAGEITMFIYPKVAEAVTGNAFTSNNNTFQFRDPEERSTKSLVRVKDGETVVIGGLIRNEVTKQATKMPILGDIPIIGGLFRHIGGSSSSPDKNKQRELLVFITPHIIKDTAADTKLAQAKKVTLPEREQEASSGVNRELAINSYMNSFEKRR